MSQQINLFNPALRPKRELVSAVNVAIASAVSLAVVAVVGSGASTLAQHARNEAAAASVALKAAQEKVTRLSQQASGAKPSPALLVELERARTQVQTREEVLANLQQGIGAGSGGYADILRALARQSLSGIWLTGLSMGPGGGGLELRGRTLDASLLADYVRRLDGEKAFAGRTFAALRMDQPKPAEPAAAGKVEPVRAEPAYLEFVLSSEVEAVVAKESKS
ncbi:MAG: hypothetical protein M0P39_11670 [Rhodocyclaceae bacterium]|nr:hypothetical protein [Rhodocyclaceae bacterium]